MKQLDIGILTSLSEPFVNIANDLCFALQDRGATSGVVSLDALALGPTSPAASVYVASNSQSVWSAASTLVRLGTGLLNGEPQICDMDRRRWKADLSAIGVNTPPWTSAVTAGALVAGAADLEFPVYLKRADHGRGYVSRFESIGDLSEYLQIATSFPGGYLVESAVLPGTTEKAYVIGDAKDVFSLNDGARTPIAELSDMAHTIQAACGLRHFSFDLVRDANGTPFIVDVNRFAVYRNNSTCLANLADCLSGQIKATVDRGPFTERYST